MSTRFVTAKWLANFEILLGVTHAVCIHIPNINVKFVKSVTKLIKTDITVLKLNNNLKRYTLEPQYL